MIVYGLWFVAGFVTAVTLTLAKWRELAHERVQLEEELKGVRLLAEHTIGPRAHPSTVAGILEQIEANRPVGISREAWFAEWFQEMVAKMKRDELT